MRLAAIDIGSNAVRLLIKEISIYKDGSLDFTKINLVRVPLRLGFDVFESGSIGAEKKNQLIETMQAFKHLLNVYNVLNYKVCATSAMRDAINRQSIIEEVNLSSGLKIEVISGSEEAQILFESHLEENVGSKISHIYIDVGGGSTELTIYDKNKVQAKRSFNIGTIRILKNKVLDSEWSELKTFLKLNTKGIDSLIGVGSGGNINKVQTLLKRKLGKPLNVELIKELYKELSNLSISERMHRYELKEDRADVIVPALEIYLAVMKWANVSEIEIPQIGLADGLIKNLHRELNFTSLRGIHIV